MIVGYSFYLIGLVCIVLGLIWLVTGKTRVFYGWRTEGAIGRILAIVVIVIGIALLCFAHFVLPRLLPSDIFDVL
ncbi:MAG TPA: hypothetical protein PKD64_04375 [Pirellulaceae bacterium]|nr:hypothetical protein [Pirellulaceae bacterium]HMO91409.1 hypothetical protein [Pirellulaceae bacterium]HMP69634.1 hypothetical protein [Pirellulaceae bacterium]